MDAGRFDRLVKALRTRRATLGLTAGLAALLGLGPSEDAAAKCTKKNEDTKCGPCHHCKKGKCKPRPLGWPCGACKACVDRECTERCPSNECVENVNVCRIACDPACGADERCLQGQCFKTCDPSCDASQGCVAGECVALSGGCTLPHDVCAGDSVSCPDFLNGRCYRTVGSQPLCGSSILCNRASDICQTDEECQILFEQPNTRCVPTCDACGGYSGCVEFYLEAAD